MACFNRFYGKIFSAASILYALSSGGGVQQKIETDVHPRGFNNTSSLGALNRMKVQHQEDPNSTTLVANKPFLLRSLFTVGALARHFDFDLEEFKGTNKVSDWSLLNSVEGFKNTSGKPMDWHFSGQTTIDAHIHTYGQFTVTNWPKDAFGGGRKLGNVERIHTDRAFKLHTEKSQAGNWTHTKCCCELSLFPILNAYPLT